MGFFADSINSITLWITSALYGGYIAANFLKWIWWRFNGWGYFWGMLSGLIIATSQFLIDKNKGYYDDDSILAEIANTPSIYLFPIIFGFSLLGCFLGTILTPATNRETLKSFYTNVRPWGFWKPIRTLLNEDGKRVPKNKNFKIDMLNCIIGILWQSSMILMPIYLVVREYDKLMFWLLIFSLTSLILKYTWLDKVKYYKD